jgi:ADP-heptose:LPS heptosyltransferase
VGKPAFRARRGGLFRLGRCFSVDVPPAARLPRLELPDRWVRAAHAQFAAWGFAVGGPVVFVNAYSKSPDRTWPLERVAVLAHVRLFSADEPFFQLPAVMRLANVVGVPVVALMRRNHPEWAPIDRAGSTVLMVPEMDDWVTRIGVDDVLAVLDAQYAEAVRPPAVP